MGGWRLEQDFSEFFYHASKFQIIFFGGAGGEGG